MSAGVGVASAEDSGQGKTAEPVPCAFESGEKVDSRPECRAQVFGYGSFGTESLANVLSSAINTGSVVMSIELPDLLSLNGVFGALGSQQGTPLFSVGEVAFGSLSSSLDGS